MDLQLLNEMGLLPERCDYCDSRRCQGECLNPPAPYAVGDTVRAAWRVGNATNGSGWVDPRIAGVLDLWHVVSVNPTGSLSLVHVDGGCRVTAYPSKVLPAT